MLVVIQIVYNPCKISVPTAGGYTFTFYVKGKANQLILLGLHRYTINSDEGDYTIQPQVLEKRL